MLAPLHRRVANLVARVVVTNVSDVQHLQTLQIGAMAGETLDAAKHYQGYGFSSVPPVGSEGVALFVGGDRAQPLVVAVEHLDSRPTEGDPGDVRVYHQDGAVILLRAGGDIVISAKPGGKVYVDDGGGGTSQLATLADVQGVRNALNGHQHSYLQPTGGSVPGFTTGGPAVPAPNGTKVLESK